MFDAPGSSRASLAEVGKAIASSLDAKAAGSRRWDALVVGAGPAGALSAILLARAGFSTLLVDRKTFPRDKVCGGCLNARAVAILSGTGLAAGLRDLGARPLQAIRLVHAGRQVRLALPPGLALSRATLDAWLVRAGIEAGVSFLPSTTAAVATDDEDATADVRRVRLRDRRGAEVVVETRIVLVADGLGHSSLQGSSSDRIATRSRFGVGGVLEGSIAWLEPGTIAMAIGRHGYAGAVEVESGRTNVAAALDADFLRRAGGPAAAVGQVFARAGLEVGTRLQEVAWSGTPALTRRLARPCGRRVLVLGDAAGYVEPFTGEGMAWAFAAARATLPFVERAAAAWDRSLEAEWTATYRRLVAGEQRWCRLLARVLRRPVLLRGILAALRIQPGLAQPVLAHLSAVPDA